MIKFNVFVALAALAFGSSLVFSAPVGFDRQDLASRETYDIEDFVARDFADVDEFHAREYLDDELEAREDELDDIFARSPLGGFRGPIPTTGFVRRRRCGSHRRTVE